MIWKCLILSKISFKVGILLFQIKSKLTVSDENIKWKFVGSFIAELVSKVQQPENHNWAGSHWIFR